MFSIQYWGNRLNTKTRGGKRIYYEYKFYISNAQRRNFGNDVLVTKKSTQKGLCFSIRNAIGLTVLCLQVWVQFLSIYVYLIRCSFYLTWRLRSSEIVSCVLVNSEFVVFFFFFSFGVLHLMLPEAPQPHGLLYYSRIGRSKFLSQFRAATPPKQRKLEL